MNDENNNYEVIKASTMSDYDGHTEFHRLSPEQRLEWLANAVEFFYLVNNQKDIE